jgi:hypothetical protein
VLTARTFFCSKERNDFIAALSPQAPARLIDLDSPWSFRVRTIRCNRTEVLTC